MILESYDEIAVSRDALVFGLGVAWGVGVLCIDETCEIELTSAGLALSIH
jgi:hypothetical protein